MKKMDFADCNTDTHYTSADEWSVSMTSKLIETFQKQNAKASLLTLNPLLFTYWKVGQRQNLAKIEDCQEAFELTRKPVEVLTAIWQAV